jgi:hypothetical protein
MFFNKGGCKLLVTQSYLNKCSVRKSCEDAHEMDILANLGYKKIGRIDPALNPIYCSSLEIFLVYQEFTAEN